MGRHPTLSNKEYSFLLNLSCKAVIYETLTGSGSFDGWRQVCSLKTTQEDFHSVQLQLGPRVSESHSQ